MNGRTKRIGFNVKVSMLLTRNGHNRMGGEHKPRTGAVEILAAGVTR